MPTFKTPLIGSYNQRSNVTPAGKDQFFKGCMFTKVVNQAQNAATYYAEKRVGASAFATPAAGSVGNWVHYDPLGQYYYTVFKSGTTQTVYKSNGSESINCGSFTANYFLQGPVIQETLSGTTYVLFSTEDTSTGTQVSECFYLPTDAPTALTYTADGNNSTTITDIKISGVNSTSGLYPGQKLTAASNIVAGTRVVSVNSGAFTAVLDTATTGGAFSDLSITKTPLAKFTDADFPTAVAGGFGELDGYIFIMDVHGKIYNSDLNSISAWTSGNYINTSMFSDFAISVARNRNQIVALGANSVEHFYNAGNPSGSPLSSSTSLGIQQPAYSGVGGLTIATIGGRLYWFGADKNIYTLEGFSPKKISSQGITATPVAMTPFTMNGCNYLNLVSSSPATTYWFCIDTGQWTEPNFANAAAYSADVIGIQGAFVFGGTTGKVYAITPSSGLYQDDSVAYTMSCQIGTDMGTDQRKIYTALRVIADTQSSGNLAVSYSDDGGASYSTARNISLTTEDKRLHRLGSGKGTRLWKFEDSGNNADRIKMIEIDYEIADVN